MYENVQIDFFGNDVSIKDEDFVKRLWLIVDVMREDYVQVCDQRVNDFDSRSF